MDTLSALDAEFLHLEDDRTPLHIGGVATFRGTPPSLEELIASIESKLPSIPRYRQVVTTVPLELGRPLWVDDQHFSMHHHVFHAALPAPGDDAALCHLVGRLMSQRLDRARPLWEAWLVEGLDHDRWALVFKVHHCMVDGVAGVGLLGAVLDLDPDAIVPPPTPWTPEPPPPPPARIAHAWAGALRDSWRLVEEVPDALVHPARSARAATDAVQGLLRIGRHVVPTPELSIEGVIGPRRCWAHASAPLARAKVIRAELGGTINDVVLAGITAGMRDLLEARGDDLDHAVVRVGVPVSVRRDDGVGVPDNRVSALLVELPVGETDPLARYAAVRSMMEEAKASHMSEVGESVTHLADLAPPFALGTVSRLLTRATRAVHQRSVTSVATNVPGPQVPLYCLGRKMEAYLPYVPIADGVRVGTAILSYDGWLAFGVTSDAASVPEGQVLASGAVAGIAELHRLAVAAAAGGSGPPAGDTSSDQEASA